MTANPAALSSIASICIDWGTTNVRAVARGADGRVADRRSAALGIRNVVPGGFPEAFARLVEGWLRPGVPVVMSGMIGSRQGWVEAPYVDCPAGIGAIAAALKPVPGLDDVSIVPGVTRGDGGGGSGGRRDVMRGEEVQCLGALALEAREEAVLCLPGTHSKWVAMSGGAIVDFATAMTGEAYEVFRRHSILGALMAGSAEAADTMDDAAFARGIALSGRPGGLLSHLFAVRADGLFGDVPAGGLSSYLSGILIGHEIREMASMFPPSSQLAGDVLVVGEGSLVRAYLSALAAVGLTGRAVPSEAATLAGLGLLLDTSG